MAEQAELSIRTADQEHPSVPHCRITLLMQFWQRVAAWSESATKKIRQYDYGVRKYLKFLGKTVCFKGSLGDYM